MSARAAAIAEILRSALEALRSLDPADRDALTAALVADIRSASPESVSALRLGPPTEPIRDPRRRT